MTWTTAELSQWSTTEELWKVEPQVSNAITIGKISRTAMWSLSHCGSNFPKNYFLPNVQPKSMLLVSMNKCSEDEEWEIHEGKKALPLKFSRKIDQAFRSAIASLSSLFCCLGFLRPIVRLTIRRKNGLPGVPYKQNLVTQSMIGVLGVKLSFCFEISLFLTSLIQVYLQVVWLKILVCPIQGLKMLEL